MGQRANLLLITPDSTELFYSHWRANTLDSDLFWGPAHATEFVRAQRSEAEGAEWLDEVWAEGAAVVDHTKKALLWYGGEDVLYSIPLRRTHLGIMQCLWPDWKIQWAYEGIVDIARYMGFPKDKVLSDQKVESTGEPKLEPPHQRDWVDGIITVQKDEELKILPLQGDPTHWYEYGPNLLSAALTADGMKTFDMADWTSEFPNGGLHIDVDHKTVAFWCAPEFEDGMNRIQAAFPDYKVTWWYDAFERHIQATGGKLAFPSVKSEVLIEQVRTIALREDWNAGEGFLDTVSRVTEAQDTQDIEINSFATRDDPVPISMPRRIALLGQAIGIWNSRQ